MKIILEYDEATGNMTDVNGQWCTGQTGMQSFAAADDSYKNVAELVKLGLSAEDIIKLKNQGVL